MTTCKQEGDFLIHGNAQRCERRREDADAQKALSQALTQWRVRMGRGYWWHEHDGGGGAVSVTEHVDVEGVDVGGDDGGERLYERLCES